MANLIFHMGTGLSFLFGILFGCRCLIYEMQLSDRYPLPMWFPWDFTPKLCGVACPSAQAPSVFKPWTPSDRWSDISHWALNSTSFEATKKCPYGFQQQLWCSSSNLLTGPCPLLKTIMGVVMCMCPIMFLLSKQGKKHANTLVQTSRIALSSQQSLSHQMLSPASPCCTAGTPGSSGFPGHTGHQGSDTPQLTMRLHSALPHPSS